MAFCSELAWRLRHELGGATYRQILLVGEDKQKSLSELILVEHALQFLTSLNNTIAIVAVDDENDTLGVLEVMPPQGTDLVLTTHIPHGELDVLVLDGLDVETWTTSRSANCSGVGSVGVQPRAGSIEGG
jgi:hypothetical protein